MSPRKQPELRTAPVTSVLEDAASAIEELKDEMESWRDNMDNANMSHLSKYDAVSECCDVFDSADTQSRIEGLVAAITACTEGRPFRAGCPEHMPGQKCKRCGWKGNIGERPMPVLNISDPLRTRLVQYHNAPPRYETTVASISNCFWTVWGEHPTEAEIEASLVEARREWWKEAEQTERLNAPPRRIPDDEEIDPLPGAETLDAPVTYATSTKRRQSRADRLGEATGLLEAATSALTEALEPLEEKDARSPDALSTGQLEYLAAVRDALDEVSQIVDELSGVEFPGMFG